MTNLKLPLCYYPTTTLFVDDSSEYLIELKGRLFDKVPLMAFSTQPKMALRLLDEQSDKYGFKRKNITSQEGQNMGSRSFEVNLETLRDYVYESDRYKEISVIVVDYEMPEMDGLTFCDRIKSPYIKKILLTGVADEFKAIDAFNEGRIDGYIRKQDPNSIYQIEKLVQKLQWNYFFRQSVIYWENFAMETDMVSPLTNPKFIQYFQNIFLDLNIEEFYLCTVTGTYFLLDCQGKDIGFWSFVEDDFEFWEDLISAKDLNPKFAEILKNKEKVALVDNLLMKDISTDEDFEMLLNDYKKIEGNETYFIAVKPQSLAIDRKRVSTLKDFKEQNNHGTFIEF